LERLKDLEQRVLDEEIRGDPVLSHLCSQVLDFLQRDLRIEIGIAQGTKKEGEGPLLRLGPMLLHLVVQPHGLRDVSCPRVPAQECVVHRRGWLNMVELHLIQQRHGILNPPKINELGHLLRVPVCIPIRPHTQKGIASRQSVNFTSTSLQIASRAAARRCKPSSEAELLHPRSLEHTCGIVPGLLVLQNPPTFSFNLLVGIPLGGRRRDRLGSACLWLPVVCQTHMRDTIKPAQTDFIQDSTHKNEE